MKSLSIIIVSFFCMIFFSCGNEGELVVSTTGSGLVYVNPPGVETSNDTLKFDVPVDVTLTALPSPGWTFHHWTGVSESTSRIVTTSVKSGTRHVSVVFVRDNQLITEAVPRIGGQIKTTPPGTHFRNKTEIIITAIPTDNFYFLAWDGDLRGHENPTKLLVDSDKHVIARFEPKIPFSDTLSINLKRDAIVTTTNPSKENIAQFSLSNPSMVEVLALVSYSNQNTNQRNESYYITFSKKDVEYQPSNPNAGNNFVVGDEVAFDGRHVWRQSGEFKLSTGTYSVSLWHYIKIADKFPEFKNGNFTDPESVHIIKLKLIISSADRRRILILE